MADDEMRCKEVKQLAQKPRASGGVRSGDGMMVWRPVDSHTAHFKKVPLLVCNDALGRDPRRAVPFEGHTGMEDEPACISVVQELCPHCEERKEIFVTS